MRTKLLVVVMLGLVAMVVLRCSSCIPGAVRVGTYNIRKFGDEPTDMKRLTAIVESAQLDVLAVQEVQSISHLRDLAGRLSRRGRHFEWIVTKCAGRSKMHLGYLFDTERVRLLSAVEYPELDPEGGTGRCGDERSGFAAKFEPVKGVGPSGGRAFQLLALHLIAGGGDEHQAKRRLQWRLVHRIAAQLAAEGPVAILGDTNSTGFLDDKGGERTFILDEAKRAGLDVVTRDLKCTEYFGTKEQLVPSVLDHFVASPSFARKRTARVHGYCAELSCAPTDRPPPDYMTVSDHCPVTVDLAP